eukprot:jgi/Hompol1/2351/HPOL_005961-RA
MDLSLSLSDSEYIDFVDIVHVDWAAPDTTESTERDFGSSKPEAELSTDSTDLAEGVVPDSFELVDHTRESSDDNQGSCQSEALGGYDLEDLIQSLECSRPPILADGVPESNESTFEDPISKTHQNAPITDSHSATPRALPPTLDSCMDIFWLSIQSALKLATTWRCSGSAYVIQAQLDVDLVAFALMLLAFVSTMTLTWPVKGQVTGITTRDPVLHFNKTASIPENCSDIPPASGRPITTALLKIGSDSDAFKDVLPKLLIIELPIPNSIEYTQGFEHVQDIPNNEDSDQRVLDDLKEAFGNVQKSVVCLTADALRYVQQSNGFQSARETESCTVLRNKNDNNDPGFVNAFGILVDSKTLLDYMPRYVTKNQHFSASVHSGFKIANLTTQYLSHQQKKTAKRLKKLGKRIMKHLNTSFTNFFNAKPE